MKTCPKCNSETEDNFDVCWNCQYSFDDDKVLENSDYIMICPVCNNEVKSYLHSCPYCHNDLRKTDQESETEPTAGKQLDCLRCKSVMDFQGNFKFDDGTRAGSPGNMLGVFINKESLDVYSCPQCGKIEFFLPRV